MIKRIHYIQQCDGIKCLRQTVRRQNGPVCAKKPCLEYMITYLYGFARIPRKMLLSFQDSRILLLWANCERKVLQKYYHYMYIISFHSI